MQRREQQTLVFSVIGAIGIILILTVAWFYGRQHIFVRYVNEEEGFMLWHPADWVHQENQGGAAVIVYSPAESKIDFFKENVNVVVQDLSANPVTLEKYTGTAIKQMQLVFGQNLVILDSSSTLLAGHPGHRFAFLGKGPEGEVQFLIVWTLVDTKAYQVTYTALSSKYDKYLYQVKRMIASFRIL